MNVSVLTGQLNGDINSSVIRDNSLFQPEFLTLMVNIGDKVTELNSQLSFNSKESAIKKYLHEGVGILEGIEVLEVMELTPPAIPNRVYDSYGSVKLSSGWLNAVFLYMNAYPVPENESGYSENNYKGCFLVNVDNSNETEIFYSMYDTVIGFIPRKITRLTLYFVTSLDADGFLQGEFLFSNFVDIAKSHPGSYIKIGYILNEYTESHSDSLFTEYSAGDPVSFKFSPSAFSEYDEFNRLCNGEMVDLYKFFMPVSDNLDYIDLNSVTVNKELIISTMGYKLNLLPVFDNGSYIVNIALEEKSRTDLLACELSIDGVEFIQSSFFSNGNYFFKLSKYTGRFDLKLKVRNSLVIGKITFKINVKKSLSRMDELVEYDKNSRTIDGNASQFTAFMNLQFTYAGMGRSLDFYFAQNENDRGYLQRFFKDSSFSGLKPIMISNYSNEQLLFFTTPINFRGNDTLYSNDIIINADSSRKGFPVMVFKMIPFDKKLPFYNNFTFIGLKSDAIIPNRFIYNNAEINPHYNTNIEYKDDFKVKVLVNYHYSKTTKIVSLKEYENNQDNFNSLSISKFLLIYYIENSAIIGSKHSSYSNEVKFIKMVKS